MHIKCIPLYMYVATYCIYFFYGFFYNLFFFTIYEDLSIFFYLFIF